MFRFIIWHFILKPVGLLGFLVYSCIVFPILSILYFIGKLFSLIAEFFSSIGDILNEYWRTLKRICRFLLINLTDVELKELINWSNFLKIIKEIFFIVW